MLPVCILCFVSLVSEHSTTYPPSVSNVLYPHFRHGSLLFSPLGYHILSTTRHVKTEDSPECECPKWQCFFSALNQNQSPLRPPNRKEWREKKTFFHSILIMTRKCTSPRWPEQQGQDKEGWKQLGHNKASSWSLGAVCLQACLCSDLRRPCAC